MIVAKDITGDKLSLFFKADKLMSVAQAVTGLFSGKSSNSAVAAADALLKQYDGLLLGFEMKKQK